MYCANLVMYICEMQFVFIMEYDLIYEDLEGLFPLQSMHTEDVH